MKLNPTQLRNFISSWLISKPKPEAEKKIETVETAARKMNTWNNHEMWYTCNYCGNQFDARKELKMICPNCGSVDLRIG